MDFFVDRMVGKEEQDNIWTLLARACYATSSPLSFTENKYWVDTFKAIRPSLQLPSRYQLSSPLLDAEYNRVNEMVCNQISSAQFVSIQLDGWTNIRFMFKLRL